MDLNALAAEARPGLEERVTAAVLAHVRAISPETTLEVVAREVERLKWRALATAALIVLMSAAMGPVPRSHSEPSLGVPGEWIEALEGAGAISFVDEGLQR